jgi:hypothetical protein
MCSQKRTLTRAKVESTLLNGIKCEYLAPKVIKELAGRVQARLRQAKRPDHKALKAQIIPVDNKIENVVGSLAGIGRSEALTAKLRRSEAERSKLRDQLNCEPAPSQIVPNVGKRLTGDQPRTHNRTPST